MDVSGLTRAALDADRCAYHLEQLPHRDVLRRPISCAEAESREFAAELEKVASDAARVAYHAAYQRARGDSHRRTLTACAAGHAAAATVRADPDAQRAALTWARLFLAH
jgi:hypothetical protein